MWLSFQTLQAIYDQYKDTVSPDILWEMEYYLTEEALYRYGEQLCIEAMIKTATVPGYLPPKDRA